MVQCLQLLLAFKGRSTWNVAANGPFAHLHLSGDASVSSQSGNVMWSWILALSSFCIIYPLARLAAALGPDYLIQWFPDGESNLPGKWVTEEGKIQGFSVTSQQGTKKWINSSPLLAAGNKTLFFASDCFEVGKKIKSLSGATKPCESDGYCDNRHVWRICLEA